MANGSKKRPWIMQMADSITGRWHSIDAYRTKEVAEAMAVLARHDTKRCWRVIHFDFEEKIK